MGRDGFVFYRSFAEALNSIGDPTIELHLYKAIVDYGLNGTKPNLSGVESAIFTLITPQIDANQRRYENGSKGGRKPKANQTETETEPKQNQGETKPKPNRTEVEPKEKEKEKDKDKDKDKENVKEKEERITFPHGEFMNVLLTADEFSKLGKELGARDRDYYIGRLSSYLHDHPRKEYKSHYRTILEWRKADEHRAELKVIANNTKPKDDSDLYARAVKQLERASS